MVFIMSILEKAKDYREENNFKTGIVLFFGGEICGWKNELRDPQSELPETLAVDSNNKIFKAVGGNDYHGAQTWIPFEDSIL